jgi:hypothetical protein
MKSLIFAAALAAAALGASAAFAFKSDEGRFSIDMPGTPKHQVINPDPADPVVMNLYTGQRGAMSFLVAFADIKVGGRKPDEVLDGARDNVLGRPGRKLLAERRVTIAGNPGRELDIAGPNDLALRVRVYLVGARLYQLIVSTTNKGAIGTEGAKFLESFRLH